MVTILRKINYANSRDEVISALEEAGFRTDLPIGLLMRETRKSGQYAKMPVLSAAKTKLEAFTK